MISAKPVWLFVALIFLVRAMVPVGFMPDFSGQHVIQICSGADIKTVLVDENGQPVEQDHQKPSDKACSFSFLSGGMTAQSSEVVVGLPLVFQTEQQATVQERLTRLFRASPLSRGPPVLFV